MEHFETFPVDIPNAIALPDKTMYDDLVVPEMNTMEDVKVLQEHWYIIKTRGIMPPPEFCYDHHPPENVLIAAILLGSTKPRLGIVTRIMVEGKPKTVFVAIVQDTGLVLPPATLTPCVKGRNKFYAISELHHHINMTAWNYVHPIYGNLIRIDRENVVDVRSFTFFGF